MMSLRGNLDVLTSLSTKNGVCAPVGGFANHVRWLALLDPVYQFELTPLVIPKYRNTLDHSRNLKFLDADSKLNSIKKLIYNESRSWNNWLAQEWLYREELNDVMRVEHVVAGHDVQKWIVLTINPNLALRCYFKMHSNLNNLTPDQFKQSIVDHNSGTEKSNSPNFRDTRKNLNADCLYQPILDKTFYNSLIDWFGLSDCYDLASEVHRIWFDRHQESEKDFIKYVDELYKSNNILST